MPIIQLDGRFNEYPIFRIFALLCLASLPFLFFFEFSAIRTRNNTLFLTTARDRLTQIQRENIINGQEAKSEVNTLPDAEQEADPEDSKEQTQKLRHS